MPERAVSQQKAVADAQGELRAKQDGWGYLGVLSANGGKARIDAFHNRLNDYLKTTPLWPSAVDTKV